ASKTVYAYVCETAHPTACNWSSLALTIKAKPAAPGVNVVNNCDGSSDLTATGCAGSLLWSNAATTSSIHVTNAATYTVTCTVDGCTRATGSGTSAPKTTPAAPILSKVDNCNNTTTITAKDASNNVIDGSQLTWTGTAQTDNPITVSTTAAVTATRNVNGCPSAATTSVTPAPKTTPAAPILSKVD